jgi:hypothetical protein
VRATLEWIIFSKSIYRALLIAKVVPYNTFIWKLTLPLKIKVFLWYLYNGVILTKGNLVRRQKQGDRKCCFYSSDESIRHLFFDCYFTKFVWRTVHVPFNLIPPTSVHNLFRGWLDGIDRKLKSKILVGASALCWAIWLTQNDIIFNKAAASSYL